MRQTSEILFTLKQYLKAKGITYQHLADEMGLSEANIKRLFSKEVISLDRLEEICGILDLELYDLTLMAKKKHQQGAAELTFDQEKKLAEDPLLAIFFYFLVNGWGIETISENYKISDVEITKFLIRLDKLGLIELHPGNHFRLLITQNIFWRKHGPLRTRSIKTLHPIERVLCPIALFLLTFRWTNWL